MVGAQFLMIGMIFFAFYLLVIRPQSKKQKEHQEMLNKLGKGEQIVTRGGVIGTITGVQDDETVVVEIQEKVRVRIPRAYIDGKWTGARKGAKDGKAARDDGEPKAA
jgi:preprotein translocase subunit YajC